MGRYLWAWGGFLWGFHCHEAALGLDGEGVIEAETILVAVALGTTYGSMFRLAPEAGAGRRALRRRLIQRRSAGPRSSGSYRRR